MKASYYNVITENPDEPGYLLYNTLNRGLCTLSVEEKRLYDRIAVGDGDHYESLVAALREGGFVLEDPETEAALIEYRYDRVKYNTEVFEMQLATTMDCNNSCIYCYETPRAGYMKPEVQDAVFEFMVDNYEQAPFKKLKISWHGGEPLLRMDVIKRLSRKFIDFCDEHDVTYIAHVTSNARLASADNSRTLRECRVYSLMTSLDGCAMRHDCRRLSRSGVPTYHTILENVDHLLDAGLTVNVSFPLERNNFAEFHEVGNELIKKPGVMVRCTQLRDYKSAFTENEYQKLDLTNRPEYSDESFSFFMEQNPSSDELAEALDYLPTFCGTPLHNWWSIDELGNVYKCCGEVGDESRKIFSLMDPPDEREVNWDLLAMYMNFSPTKDAECRKCRVLPLCQGECAFEHILFGRYCRTFFYTIEDYVKAYYQALCREANETTKE